MQTKTNDSFLSCPNTGEFEKWGLSDSLLFYEWKTSNIEFSLTKYIRIFYPIIKGVML